MKDRTETFILAAVFVVLLTVATPQAADQANDKNCGPPHYCARTDRKIEPYAAQPPALGPAGTIITDPSFGSRILRVTDAKSDDAGQARGLMTASASEQNTWNSSSTRFYVRTPSAETILYDFNPQKMKAHQHGVLPAPWLAEPEFSSKQPDVIYGVRSPWRPAFQQYDISTGKFTRLNLWSDCVPIRNTDYAVGPSLSADEQRMAGILGKQQDLYRLIYVYDRKLGCRWYNTKTGEIGGQWGPKGTISIPDRFGIHNAKISMSGKYIEVTRGAGIVGNTIGMIWEVDTLNVALCQYQCIGHHVLGYSHLINPSEQSHPFDLLKRPLDELNATTPLVANLQRTPNDSYWFDLHPSWNNDDPSDTAPVCMSTYQPAALTRPGATIDMLTPWGSEILCVETDGKASTVWRFAHNYTSARNGFWSTPRGNVSQDGKFFMFTSDWENELGKDAAGRQRTDVFIVELR